MKKTICAFLFLCPAVYAYATSVAWNKAFLVDENYWDADRGKLICMGSPYLNMWMNFLGDDLILSAQPESNLVTANTFVKACKGDVVDAGYIAYNLCFAYAEYDECGNGRTWTDYSLTFSPGDSYYLAFREERYNSTTYGWVQLGYTYGKELEVMGSAWDMDGDSIIVGAIPEPSGGMLFLLGIACLTLRRRRPIG